MEIEIRRAVTTEDRLAVLAISRPAFAPGSFSLVYAARRLASARCTRATWWLLMDEDGQPASGLLAYDDLVLRRGDERRRTCGLGAVSTRSDARGRGYASRLCAHVAEEHGGAGLLFSGIQPAFYERLGYVTAQAWEFVSTDLDGLIASGPVAGLRPLDPRRERETLAEAWRDAHEGWYLDRDEVRWDATLLDHPRHVFFGLEAGGYVWLNLEKDCIWIVERATPDPDAALRAVATLSRQLSLSSVQGWLDPDPLLRTFFEDQGRTKTLPMLRGVEHAASGRFSSADYF